MIIASVLWHHASVAATTITAIECDLSPRARHGGERLVTRCIKEGNFLAVDFDLICANMLSDATSFTCATLFCEWCQGKEVLPWSTCSHDSNYPGNDNHVIFVTRCHHGFVAEVPAYALYCRSHSQLALIRLETKVSSTRAALS